MKKCGKNFMAGHALSLSEPDLYYLGQCGLHSVFIYLLDSPFWENQWPLLSCFWHRRLFASLKCQHLALSVLSAHWVTILTFIYICERVSYFTDGPRNLSKSGLVLFVFSSENFILVFLRMKLKEKSYWCILKSFYLMGISKCIYKMFV